MILGSRSHIRLLRMIQLDRMKTEHLEKSNELSYYAMECLVESPEFTWSTKHVTGKLRLCHCRHCLGLSAEVCKDGHGCAADVCGPGHW